MAKLLLRAAKRCNRIVQQVFKADRKNNRRGGRSKVKSIKSADSGCHWCANYNALILSYFEDDQFHSNEKAAL